MIEVIYKSKKNNKKIAKAIADELQVDAKNIKQVQDVKADILFLGCPILGGNIPEQVTRFVAQLDANKVKKVILFSANGFGTDQFTNVKAQLMDRCFHVKEVLLFLKTLDILIKRISRQLKSLLKKF